MNSLEIANRYFDAWNLRDASAVLDTFAEGGTYSDPTTGGPLSGDALIAYIQGLVSAFPDLSFEITTVGFIAPDVVAAQWIMRGTNFGSINGLPPTGKSIELHGADFIGIVEDGIRSVEGYFDSGVVPRQIGLQVVVQPTTVGPFSFGTSTRASSGRTATPGAFSITWLEARSEEEREYIVEISRKVATEMLSMPGFIGWVGTVVGDRMMTVTAWETPEAMAPLIQGGEHRSAVRRFFSPEMARGGGTGVWIPARLNPRWIRCAACSKMVDSERSQGNCQCGAALPDPLPYW